jgi:pimeloyl-ACP methyl ester carboxylesterase
MRPLDGVRHAVVDVDGIQTFYRFAGPDDAPVLLLPHGYPASSFEFRALMPALADRWRVVAPDGPGFGYSATPHPDEFPYTFAAYATWLRRFAEALGLDRYALWLHDYGSQFGLELAMAAPERVTGLIIQNGDIHRDEFGPKYDTLTAYWESPTGKGRAQLAANVTEAGFRDEFVGEIPVDLVDRVPPELWTLHWALMNTAERRENVVRLFDDQAHTLDRFALRTARRRSAPLRRRTLAARDPPRRGRASRSRLPRSRRAGQRSVTPTRSVSCFDGASPTAASRMVR